MKDYKRFQLLILITIFSVGLSIVIGANVVQKRISSRGTIFVSSPNLEAYWDLECTNPVSEVNWGKLAPGEQKTKTIFVKNTGNLSLTISLTTDFWDPPRSNNSIFITWDQENTRLSQDELVQAIITINVSASISGISDFSFTITISGSE